MRIVSLVPSITELLHDLSLKDEVVGLTRFCERPPGWKQQKQIVGGTKDVRVDRVEALAPDLVIANREENRREDVEAIAQFSEVLLTDVAALSDALEMIESVAARTNRILRGRGLADEIRRRFDVLPSFKPVRALYLIWKEPYMSVGSDTFIHDMMTRAGLENVMGRDTRYPLVELRALNPLPEVVLLSSEPFPFETKHVSEVQNELPHAQIFLVDGQPFSWYGSRLRHTPSYLRDLRLRIDRAVKRRSGK